ncbi:hypothetical protein QQF64_033651 [Cirrhinus molitorella]|uniref:Uncharacterized protein n=1 Tax=Cirrhinus molitorella TaxID=172907 RepID=A0ABR3MUH9_9TELE
MLTFPVNGMQHKCLMDASPSTSGHRSYASISYGSVGLAFFLFLCFISLFLTSPASQPLFTLILVWVIDADDDGYWLTVYPFGILLLTELWFSDLEAEQRLQRWMV